MIQICNRYYIYIQHKLNKHFLQSHGIHCTQIVKFYITLPVPLFPIKTNVIPLYCIFHN